jgi:hypothetical protein
MNPSTFDAYGRLRASNRSMAREALSFPREDEPSHRHPLWSPEDIAEPETWTLESFSDLLSHETA